MPRAKGLKPNGKATKLLQRLAALEALPYHAYLKRKTLEALAIERHLGPKAFRQMLMLIEEARLQKEAARLKAEADAEALDSTLNKRKRKAGMREIRARLNQMPFKP